MLALGTIKFLACLSCARRIVTEKWLVECQKAGRFVSTDRFILKKETEPGVTVPQALERAAKQRVFTNRKIFISSHCKPTPDQAAIVIQSAGGRLLKSAPTVYDDNTFVISCAEDKTIANKLSSLGYAVHDKEFLIRSVLQQKILFNEYASFVIEN